MKLHKVRQVLGSSRGEVFQIQQQADNDKRTKKVFKPSGSALLHGLLRQAAGSGQTGQPGQGGRS
jgi:hypothetical protein